MPRTFQEGPVVAVSVWAVPVVVRAPVILHNLRSFEVSGPRRWLPMHF